MGVLQKETDCHGVARVILNREHNGNALDDATFKELLHAFQSMEDDPQVRVVVLCGNGAHFCSGIDLATLQSSFHNTANDDGARDRAKLAQSINQMQEAISSLEKCRKPVIATIHGGCIGGGIDLIAACDMRFCTKDAFFCVKEVDLGITADLGTLQRLPFIVGYATTMDLALTARTFNGIKAGRMGLVSGVFDSKNEMDMTVQKLATEIASKSPLAVQGTKTMLVKGRDLSVSQGLEYIAVRNSAMLSTEDVKEAIQALNAGRKPVLAKL